MSSLWNRLMSAANAFITTFNERALIPTEFYDWDTYQSRIFRYFLSESYYTSTIYRAVTPFSQRLKSSSDLYRNIRAVQNPVYRLVEAYVAKVYGGSIDMEDLSGGAIPILTASDPLKEALKQLYLWSNWNIQKGLYVRQGAQLGDVYLKIVDEPDSGRVRLEVVHPGKIKNTETDAVGNIKRAFIQYERQDPTTLKWIQYTETIDQERFTIALTGQQAIEFPNLYGFVPLVHVKHKDVGMQSGANAFHAQMGKIDELNDASSILNDQVRKAVDAVWFMFGKKGSEINIGSDQNTLPSTLDGLKHARDKGSIIYGPKDGKEPFAMVAPIDIAGAGANIDRILAELERDMPELAMHRLRDGGNLTAPGVRSAYSDAIDRFVEAQGNYDDGLIRAQKMAVSIGGMRGYEGFGAFNLDSYAKGDLDHYIKARPIVEDELSKQEKIQGLQAAGASIQLIMKEMDFDQQTIDEEVARQKEKQQAIQPGKTVTPDSLSRVAGIWDKLGMQELTNGMENSGLPQPPALPNGKPQLQGAPA